MTNDDLTHKILDEIQKDLKEFKRDYRADQIRTQQEFKKFKDEDDKTHGDLLVEFSKMNKKVAVIEEKVKNLSFHRATMIGFISAVIATFLAYKIETMGHDVVIAPPKKDKKHELGGDNPPNPRDP